VSTVDEDKYLEYLKREMDKFIRKYYGVKLAIPVTWSSRLRVKWGYFSVKRKNVIVTENGRRVRRSVVDKSSMKIVLNKDLLHAKSKELVLGIAKHEALHYALFVTGKPFRDGSAYFENELRKHNLPRTGIGTKELGTTSKYWVWICKECTKIVKRGGKTHKNYARDYVSGCCSAMLEEVGWVYLKPDQKYINKK